jgi:group I intron endonuclease
MACENEYYVYKHTTPNNKVYIGITKQNPNRRWRNGHGYSDSVLFFNAIIKYGWVNITHEILKEGISFEEANELEKYYIALYKSNQREFGYNITQGGECRRTSKKEYPKTKKIGTGKNKGKTVLVFNTNNEYVGEFVSSY